MDQCQRHLATRGAGLHHEWVVTLSGKILAMSMATQLKEGGACAEETATLSVVIRRTTGVRRLTCDAISNILRDVSSRTR